ncbi:MAG: G1 family glutamic endopeptidase [Ktedonobacterales bacterium]
MCVFISKSLSHPAVSLLSPVSKRSISQQLQFSKYQSGNWDGNYADEDTPGQNYTEADTDYYVACTGNHPSDGNGTTYSAWVGLGGIGSDNFPQAGTAEIQYIENGSYVNWLGAWTENLSNTASPYYGNPVYWFYPHCGDHMYATAWNSGSTGCSYVEDFSQNDVNSGNYCEGNASNGTSAEFIVEDPVSSGAYAGPDFANFGTETFYGVGITDNGGYYAMSSLPHDYDQLYHCNFRGIECISYGDQLAKTGSIDNDPGDIPYDEYSITWVNYK